MEPVYHPREEFGEIHIPADTHLNEETKAVLTKQSDNWQDVSVTEDESRAIEKVQDEWHAQRKRRITTSKFGVIMKR